MSDNHDEFIYLTDEFLTMSRKIVSGVLEHLIFELRNKDIRYEIKEMGKENGYPEQIIVKIKEKELFVYIIKHKRKITYSISEGGQEMKSISRPDLLEKVKRL